MTNRSAVGKSWKKKKSRWTGGKTPNTATYQNSQTLKKKWTGGDSNSEADSANHASAEAEEREPSRRNLGAMRPRAQNWGHKGQGHPAEARDEPPAKSGVSVFTLSVSWMVYLGVVSNTWLLSMHDFKQPTCSLINWTGRRAIKHSSCPPIRVRSSE